MEQISDTDWFWPGCRQHKHDHAAELTFLANGFTKMSLLKVYFTSHTQPGGALLLRINIFFLTRPCCSKPGVRWQTCLEITLLLNESPGELGQNLIFEYNGKDGQRLRHLHNPFPAGKISMLNKPG
jgi:hypothetical protein